MSARDLLAAATPRPWTDVFVDMIAAMPEPLGGGKTWNVTVAKGLSFEDKTLIVAAVNEYEPHVDAETPLRTLLDWDARWPDTRIHSATDFKRCHDELQAVVDDARVALARLDAVRNSA